MSSRRQVLYPSSVNFCYPTYYVIPLQTLSSLQNKVSDWIKNLRSQAGIFGRIVKTLLGMPALNIGVPVMFSIQAPCNMHPGKQ